MLPELSEADARGTISGIYSEVRTLCGVPYVSSLHRHLATRTGWLEWCWAAVGPAYASGAAQSAAWEAAAAVPVEPLPPISAAALRLMGVPDPDVAGIREVCESFIRVAPTNLMFVALARGQLARHGVAREDAAESGSTWTPPAAPARLPALVDVEAAHPDLRDALLQLANPVAGHAFVPGFYRMLGHWPGYLAHVATELGPRFVDATTRATCDAVVGAVDAASEPVLASLAPPPATVPRPPEAEHADVLAVMERYRKTSPEMVVFGRALRAALPGG